jgi:hypothetical protein
LAAAIRDLAPFVPVREQTLVTLLNALEGNDEAAERAERDLLRLAHEAALAQVQPADTALPQEWAERAWQLGLSPIGHVAWSYASRGAWGHPVGLCPYGRHIVDQLTTSEG